MNSYMVSLVLPSKSKLSPMSRCHNCQLMSIWSCPNVTTSHRVRCVSKVDLGMLLDPVSVCGSQETKPTSEFCRENGCSESFEFRHGPGAWQINDLGNGICRFSRIGLCVQCRIHCISNRNHRIRTLRSHGWGLTSRIATLFDDFPQALNLFALDVELASKCRLNSFDLISSFLGWEKAQEVSHSLQ